RLNAQEKVRQRRKLALGAFAQNRFPGALAEAFDLQDGHANAAVRDGELRSGLIDERSQQGNPKAMAFEHIHERIIKAFAVGENRRHEFRGIIEFEPCGLVSFDAISRAVSFAKGVALEAGDKVPDFGNVWLQPATLAGAFGKFNFDL